MQIDTNNLVSMTEANQNFSRVARMVDKNGAAVILKNNTPRYVLLEFNQFIGEEMSDDTRVQDVGEAIVKRHMRAFLELAK